jgi:hypothetical protein
VDSSSEDVSNSAEEFQRGDYSNGRLSTGVLIWSIDAKRIDIPAVANFSADKTRASKVPAPLEIQ